MYNKNRIVIPSELKSFDELPENASINTVGVKNKEDYSYYYDCGIWMPHRTPTINEILKNEFNS